MNVFNYSNSLAIEEKYTLSDDYLEIIGKVLRRQFERFKRVTLLRFDLRFPAGFQCNDAEVISRFIEAFKSRLITWNKQRTSVHPIGFQCIWCREKAKGSLNWHYHVAFLFNKDAVLSFGNADIGLSNTYNRIHAAWLSAIGIGFTSSKLVNICKDGVYWLDQNSVGFVNSCEDVKYRLSYMAKIETKGIGDGNRHFGCSQKIFMG